MVEKNPENIGNTKRKRTVRGLGKFGSVEKPCKKQDMSSNDGICN